FTIPTIEINYYTRNSSSQVYVLSLYGFIFFFMLQPHPSSTLFPYTTLFRSDSAPVPVDDAPHGGETDARALEVGSGMQPLEYPRSEEHTSELQSRGHLVCRLLLEKKKISKMYHNLLVCGLTLAPAPTLTTCA